MKKLILSFIFLTLTTAILAQCWKQISVNDNHGLAIAKDGTLWAWGGNYYGQLGVGDNNARVNPVQVGTDNDWKMCAAGNDHSAAIKNNGDLYTWGNNYYKILGDSTSTNRNTPMLVTSGGENWNYITAGSGFTIAIKNNGDLWAWGNNSLSQLGLPNQSVGGPYTLGFPKFVSGGWASVNATYRTVVAIKTDGSLYTWGQDALFNGFDVDPKHAMGGGNNWIEAKSGNDHFLARKSDGTIWSWGYNNNYQLGFANSTINQKENYPVQIGSATNWVSIATGYSVCQAVNSLGELYFWGWNNNSFKFENILYNNQYYSTPTKMGTSNTWKKCHSNLAKYVQKNNGTWYKYGRTVYYGANGYLPDDDNVPNYDLRTFGGTSCQEYTITATAHIGGSISPNAATIVNSGSNQTYSITPNANTCIDSIVVDGSKVSNTNSYTFNNVTANHSIDVYFKNKLFLYAFIDSSSSVVSNTKQYTFTVSTNPTPIIATYAFYVNNNLVQNNTSNVFTTASLNDFDTIKCIVNADNTECLNNYQAATTNIVIVSDFTIAPITGGNYTSGNGGFCPSGPNLLVTSDNIGKFYCATPGGVWSVDDASKATINQQGQIKALVSGSTNVRYTVIKNGITKSVTKIIDIISIQTEVGSLSKSVFCVGENTNITTSLGGSIFLNGTFNRYNISPSGSIQCKAAGTDYVTYKNVYATSYIRCTVVKDFLITINPLPAVPSVLYSPINTVNPQAGAGSSGIPNVINVCNNKTFILRGTPSGGSWLLTGLGSLNVLNAQDASITTNGLGMSNIKYTVTDAQGCSNFRQINAQVVNCGSKSAITNNSFIDNKFLSIYPNPANGKINIDFSKNITNGNIIIANFLGKIVKQQQLTLGSNTIDVSNLAKGNYFVTLITNGNSQTQKVIIE